MTESPDFEPRQHASCQHSHHQGRPEQRSEEACRCDPRSDARYFQGSSARQVNIGYNFQEKCDSLVCFRFQIITQHEPGEIIAEDVNLGYKRTDKLVILHIFQQGRDKGTKESTYAALAAALERETNLSGDDLIISVSTNTKDDWSLGRGRPAFACGDL